jgi:hypothetical protein
LANHRFHEYNHDSIISLCDLMIDSTNIFYMLFLRSKTLYIFLLCAILITACGARAGAPAGGVLFSVPGVYEIDPLFRDFYRQLGGEEVLGAAISHPFTYGEISFQYTLAGRMAHDPQAPEHARSYMEPIGLDLGVLEAAVQPPDDPELRYVDGHIIDPLFLPLYQKLGEGRGAGKPLTEARYNPAMQRVEQYFENLGFYRSDTDPTGTVRLMGYGLWKCASSCMPPSSLPQDSFVEPPLPVAPEFRKAVERLGQSFTGFALSTAYTASDGAIEQVFENVLLATLPGKNGQVFLRPLPVKLGISPEPLEIASSKDNMFFYPISEVNGYNVPQIFLDYLARHGGLDASGPPITTLGAIREGVYRQCFANLCLEEHRHEQGALRIRLTPLGFTFWQAQPQSFGQGGVPATSMDQEDGLAGIDQPTLVPTQTLTQPAADGVVVHVWKKFPVLSPGQRQEINVIVLKGDVPVRDLHSDLILTLPAGESFRYDMAPTGSDGQSQYTLEPIDTPVGKAVEYQVCVYSQPGDATCVEDSFLVWQN